MLVFFKGTRLDFAGVVVCVVLLSISGLFYIIAGQRMFAKALRWVPYSGFVDGWGSLRFLVLPVLVGLISGLCSQARFYRTLFLDAAGKDYVRSAGGEGVYERREIGGASWRGGGGVDA